MLHVLITLLSTGGPTVPQVAVQSESIRMSALVNSRWAGKLNVMLVIVIIFLACSDRETLQLETVLQILTGEHIKYHTLSTLWKD